MNWAGTLHPPLAACPFRYQRAGKTNEETGLVDTKVSSQLGNESSRASVGGLYSDLLGPLRGLAGLRLPVLAPDTLHRGCPWHPGEPHAKNKGVFILRGGPLQAQLPCLLGRATHTPELPWRTTTLCSYISRTLPQVTAWLGSSHAPSGPPKSTSITRH